MRLINLLQTWVPVMVFKPEIRQLVHVGVVPKALFLHGEVAWLHLRIFVLVVKEGEPRSDLATVALATNHEVVLLAALPAEHQGVEELLSTATGRVVLALQAKIACGRRFPCDVDGASSGKKLVQSKGKH